MFSPILLLTCIDLFIKKLGVGRNPHQRLRKRSWVLDPSYFHPNYTIRVAHVEYFHVYFSPIL